jgi:SAM-dependent methyltransferase
MDHPPLPDGVRVTAGTDAEPLWQQFHVFEALHHGMDIMNPLSSADLDKVVAALGASDGDRVLDLGCGHGELLLRLAAGTGIDGVGIDLSPWQIARAASRSAQRPQAGALSWLLGTAADIPAEPVWDVVACLGASWIWGGFEGTARALHERCRPGGRVALGDLQRRPGADPGDVPADYGSALSREAQLEALTRIGITPITEVAPGPDGWIDYDRRTAASAAAYLKLHPGERAEGFMEEQRRWVEEHDLARVVLAWTVWVGRVDPGR